MVDRGRLDRFFAGLRARIDLAREVDAQLDRQLAQRFNVLDYIRTSELGLSRVIGDLLDPKASHGQGLLFLDIFLRGLKRSSEKTRRPLDLTLGYGDKWTVCRDTVHVRLERTISGNRRLDVSVEFEGSDGRWRCLAIENKPIAPASIRLLQEVKIIVDLVFLIARACPAESARTCQFPSLFFCRRWP